MEYQAGGRSCRRSRLPAIFAGGVSHAGHQLDWVYSSRSMDNGVCRLYCRSNQRRGGAQHALCRACGSVWEGVLFVTSPTWSAVLSPPLLSVYACCLLASFLLSFFLVLHLPIFLCGRANKRPRFLAHSLEFPVGFLGFSRRDGPHPYGTPPFWPCSTFCPTPSSSIAFLLRLHHHWIARTLAQHRWKQDVILHHCARGPESTLHQLVLSSSSLSHQPPPSSEQGLHGYRDRDHQLAQRRCLHRP